METQRVKTKTLILIRIAILVFCTGLLFSATSCAVFVAPAKDNGRHLGWYKNSNNSRNSFKTNKATHKEWFKKSNNKNSAGRSFKAKHKGKFVMVQI